MKGKNGEIMIKTQIKAISWFLIVWFPLFTALPAFAQEWSDETGSTGDDGLQWEEPPPDEQPAPPPPQPVAPQSRPSAPQAPVEMSSSSSMESEVQNAVIEGVQLSSEPSDKPDEKIVSCYFIFRDKPSSYFYEIKVREKKLVFEFNDTRVGASPVPSSSEHPIRGFTVEQRKVDVNKEVRGLKPEWHDLIRVVFDLENVPDVHVNDEYSIISFSYKWTNNPDKQGQYVVKDKSPAVIFWSSAGIGGVGLGVLAWFLLKPKQTEPPLEKLETGDLPQHKL
jgi:hypothetical protein